MDDDVEESECQYEHTNDSSIHEEMVPEYALGLDCAGQNVSLHTVNQRSSTSAWAQIRPMLRKVAVECSAMPENQSCLICSKSALYRCLQCGANAYYCRECYNQVHCAVNMFHVGEIWQVRKESTGHMSH